MSKHGIHFENATVHWTEALPLGNGTFGAMAYLEGQNLRLAMNHYEVYYSCLPDAAQQQFHEVGGETKKHYVERARAALCRAEKTAYQSVLYPSVGGKRQTRAAGQSFPAAGELEFCFAPQPAWEKKAMSLCVEDAEVSYSLGQGTELAQLKTKILQGTDTLFCTVDSKERTPVTQLRFFLPQGRNMAKAQAELRQTGPGEFLVEQTVPRPDGTSFQFALALRLEGTSAAARQEAEQAWCLALEQTGRPFHVLVSIATQMETTDCASRAVEKSLWAAQQMEQLLEKHRTHWENFFSRSSVTLPDAFLENLWYMNLYVLECSSGRGGRQAKQASGLNGLWDIRRPSLWGSMWYWDVNIQATYWGTYTANHLELSQVFCDGFLLHEADGIRFAEEFHGLPGYASDYPHPFYNCIGPWCAQFLWWQYEYGRDETFLREKAYPHFVKQVRFLQELLQKGESNGTLELFPDVSPEQGPLGHNSVISIASIRYLLRFTKKAAEILRQIDGMQETCERLLADLPDYETAQYQNYGEILKDSHEAEPGMHLRHPSLLMPVFPAEEWNQYSPRPTRDVAESTVRYAADNTELGVFGFGWLACAAARMGLGDLALKTLYEKGFDLHLRANGMGAEETNRWMNLCLVNKPPMYYPFMMECVGETIAAVGELLLQSSGDGRISVFPALPEAWKDCVFEGLLAKGGVEVSAQRRDGKTVWIQLECRETGIICLRGADGLGSNDLAKVQYEEGQLILQAEAGGAYTFGVKAENAAQKAAPRSYTSHTGARIFAGKDRNTDYERMMDSFICDHYVADTRHRKRIIYFFGMGWEADCLPEEEQRTGFPLTVLWENENFDRRKGYGFRYAGNVGLTITGGEQLAQRYLASDEEAVFLMDLPRGQYDLLVGCSESCHAVLECCGQRREVLTKRGENRAVLLPVVQEEDGLLELKICPADGKVWKIHTIICRKQGVFS